MYTKRSNLHDVLATSASGAASLGSLAYLTLLDVPQRPPMCGGLWTKSAEPDRWTATRLTTVPRQSQANGYRLIRRTNPRSSRSGPQQAWFKDSEGNILALGQFD
jgi:hypothetical protein